VQKIEGQERNEDMEVKGRGFEGEGILSVEEVEKFQRWYFELN
jgi:hypothetical protein